MKNYYLAKYKFFNQKFDSLPCISRGIHEGAVIYRIKSDDKTRILRKNKKSAQKYESTVEERERCLEKIEEAKAFLLKEFKNVGAIDKAARHMRFQFVSNGQLNKEFWDSLRPNSAKFKNDNNYVLDGNSFRSRVEYRIAEQLRDMGLPYKYECEVCIGGVTLYPDFVVYLEEFECCFIIEYLGMLDKYDYVRHTIGKLETYITNQIYPYKDIILLCGNSREMPSKQEIRNAINYMIDSIADKHIILAS